MGTLGEIMRTDFVTVAPEDTIGEAAQRMAERTDGAFDVTVGPLSRIWRRARITGGPPNPSSVASAKALVGYRLMRLSSDRTVRLAKAGMLLDLGGIAKGYAADQALAVLRASGAPRAPPASHHLTRTDGSSTWLRSDLQCAPAPHA